MDKQSEVTLPTVAEAKKAYVDAVERYRAEVEPTAEELERAEQFLSDFDDEETHRDRGSRPGELDGLDADERILDQVMEQREEEEEKNEEEEDEEEDTKSAGA